MSSVPGVDHPAEQAEIIIRLRTSNESVSAVVESVDDGVMSVRPSTGELAGQSGTAPGELVDVHWVGLDGHRSAPAEVTDVEHGDVDRWRMTQTGPAEHSQRRDAVRGRLVVPVTADIADERLTGETADLSEGGVRAVFGKLDPAPEEGSHLALQIMLEDGPVLAGGRVVRLHTWGKRSTLSIAFQQIEERDRDRIRRRVFRALREERAREAQ
jgi:PilZ domain-containing protein